MQSTLVGFKGAGFLTINAIYPVDRFESGKYKPAPFTKIVKSAAPSWQTDPLYVFQ